MVAGRIAIKTARKIYDAHSTVGEQNFGWYGTFASRRVSPRVSAKWHEIITTTEGWAAYTYTYEFLSLRLLLSRIYRRACLTGTNVCHAYCIHLRSRCSSRRYLCHAYIVAAMQEETETEGHVVTQTHHEIFRWDGGSLNCQTHFGFFFLFEVRNEIFRFGGGRNIDLSTAVRTQIWIHFENLKNQ